jgi:hypothetical protein
VRVLDRGLIYNAETAPANAKSCAFTSLTLLASGELLASFRIGSGRDAPDGRLRIVRSPDLGRSWETLHPGMTAVLNGIEGNLYSGYFTELAPNRLVGAFVWVDRSNPELSFVNPVTAGVLPMRNLLAESSDGGATWSDFRLLDLAPEPGCSCTGPVFALANGDLAFPYERWKEYDDPSPGEHAACLRVSHDGGSSWPQRELVATDPAFNLFFWDQRFARHPETGELVAMFWTHDRQAEQDIENHLAWGRADGARWTTPSPAGWRGQHCQPLALGGDRLAALYVRRHDPPSLRTILSEDFGRSWMAETEVAFYESAAGDEPGGEGTRAFEDFWQDMMAWRFGHPRGVLLPDGTIFVAFYAGDSASTSMHWVRLAA